MARTQEYKVVLRDSEGYEIDSRSSFGPVKDAKAMAKYMATAAYVRTAWDSDTITHETLGSDRIEIIDEAGDIVWDMEVKV